MTSIGSSEIDQTAEAPHRAMCSLCDRAPAFCRGCCRSCYRKLGEADALPPTKEQGRRRVHPLRRWLATLDNALLIQMAAWIEELRR